MAVSKAQQRAVATYTKNNYDEIKLRVPKGQRDIIRAYAKAKGETVNALLNRLVDEAMQQDKRK